MYKFSSQRLVRFVSDDDPVGARHGSLDGGMMFVPVINSVYNRPQWTPHFIQAIGADIYGANWLGAAEGPRGMQVCMAVRMGHRGKQRHNPGLGIAPVKQSRNIKFCCDFYRAYLVLSLSVTRCAMSSD